MTARRLLALFALLAVLGVAAGCRVPAVGEDGWQLTATFDNVLNLPRGAAVKVGGVEVGEVTGIAVEDYAGVVTMTIEEGTSIPRGSDFRLRYTTALGELYVDVTPAAPGPALADGAVLGERRTATAPTVEDTLASASLLINGGSLTQIQTIVSELNTALAGRTGAARGVLREVDRFLGQALRSTRQVDRILRALAASSRTLRDRERTIDAALRDLRPAARTLTENTDELVGLLKQTDRLARTADGLLMRTRDDLVLVVEELGPVLDSVLAIEDRLVAGLDIVNALALDLDRAVPTDYLNLFFVVHATTVLGPTPGTDPGPGGGDTGTGTTPGLLPLPEPELPPLLPGLDLGGLLGGLSGTTRGD